MFMHGSGKVNLTIRRKNGGREKWERRLCREWGKGGVKGREDWLRAGRRSQGVLREVVGVVGFL